MGRIETLVMHDVTRRFGTATALHRFNLSIAGGTFVTLLGPSGCGKSTALNCLAGLLDLSSGEIVLNDKPIQHVPAEKRGFGMVFQNYALFPHLTAERNVGYGLELRRVPRAERERRVQRAMEMVHLEEFGKRYPAQMSGGQQQRLAIARTIVLEPSLLLLDEPLSNLDANLRNEMRIEIKRIHTTLGLTTIYVTHDQSEAMSMSDRVLVMRAGRIEQAGTPQEIYTRPQNLYVASFMGYANRLPVTVLGRDGQYYSVQTQGGTRLQATSTTDDTWQAGQAATLCFRPDDTCSDPLPAVNHLSGTVQLVEYMGKSFEALVRLDDPQGEQLLVHSEHAVPSRTMLTFGMPPDRLLLFANDATVPQGQLFTRPMAEPVLTGER